jgi:hypothetical protein
MTEHEQHVVPFSYTGSAANETYPVRSHSSAVVKTIWCIAGITTALLALRFVLMFLGANQNHQFVDIIYTISTPFVAPFFGLFGYTAVYDVSSFEYSTLVAIAAYAFLAWGLARLTTTRQFRHSGQHHRRHARSHA